MNSFISTVVKDLLSKNIELKNLILVLPSRRACVFLREELINSLTKSDFLPKIISIENYIQELADIKLIENTKLLFECYSVYKNIIPKNEIEPFDIFSQWATTALHDFNEIDSYLVNSTNLFDNLKDLKKLENWFQEKNPSTIAKNYLAFLENLGLLYENLYETLKSKKFGYQGLIYREAIENLEFYIEQNSENHIAFIGFNALNKAEENIFQELLKRDLASVYWDVNSDMLAANNEAGFFLRKYKKEWDFYNNKKLEVDECINEDRTIKIFGVPKNITQVKFASELLLNVNKFDNTALVLADEKLLNPTLSSLPKSISQINITMGYMLEGIPISLIFENIFALYLNQEKLNKKLSAVFYYKDVLNILNNSFLNKLSGGKLQKVIVKIKNDNNVFVSNKYLTNVFNIDNKDFNSTLLKIFDLPNSVNEIIEFFSDLILEIKDYVESLEKEYLFRFYKVFQQLKTLNEEYNFITNLKSLAHFYNQLLKIEKLSFLGEPLNGLQLMGMLETRALDFETIIMTSVNEGILPASKNENSFLPYDVKKYFDLPTYQEKDAIFSYHFQRLLMRAKNVYLLYNTEQDGYGSGEKSRFLTQLQIKYPEISENIIAPQVMKETQSLNTIEKSKEVINKLEQVFKKGISPSALANYIYNPIKFYEQKVLEIEDLVEIEETVAANTMGTVIHEVLDQLYQPFIGEVVKINDIKTMFTKIEVLLNKNFKKFYNNELINTGKNKLIYEVCKNHIYRFLNQEKELLKNNNSLKIIDLEPRIETKLLIKGIDFPVNIVGKIDRIDELNGVTRIIDYKTGKVEAKDLKINDFSMLSEDYKFTKALQVMIYSFLYTKERDFDFSTQLEAGIISFKNLNTGFLKINFSEGRQKETIITSEKIDEFLVELKRIIKEILNPEISFTEKTDLPF